ncbi:hypothetical protein GQ457_07G005540 [Hibiscus cannabinus]
MTLEHDGNGANVFDEGPGENNELNGIDESVNGIVGEDSNNIDGDISGSDWVDGDNILSDDDDNDDDELASLKNKFNVIIKFSTGLIEEDLRGLGSGEGTEYLDSSDVGSYKTDSDGDVVLTQHQCSVTYKNKRANFKLVGKHFLPKIRILPKLKVFDIKRLVTEELKVDLHKRTCLKARKWALEKIRGNVVHEFNRLFDYVFALRSADPNGTFDLMVERPTDVATPKFKRLYVCFSALKEGFKRFCRPIISLDGCYLKGEIKGEILSAVGRDGNNQIFPIAWALVEVENRETWAWFLENIQRDLNIGDGSKFTFISDMQKGLIEEVQLCLPNVEHRFCASICMPIGKNRIKADPRHWSKPFFSTRSKCDAVDNNYSEAFNSAILGARFKSFISMFEDIKHYVMGRLVEHKKKNQLVGKVNCALELKKT